MFTYYHIKSNLTKQMYSESFISQSLSEQCIFSMKLVRKNCFVSIKLSPPTVPA